MRMALNSGPVISAAEVQRRSQIQDQCLKRCRAQQRTQLKTMFFEGARGIFYFLLGATLVTVSVAHRNEIDAVAKQKVRRVVAHVQAKTQTTDPLRKNALNYEKEVEEAGK